MSKCKLTDNSASTTQAQGINKAKSRLSPDSTLLLTLNQVAELLNIGRKGALRILRENGIQPIDYGPGRGNGLRWYKDSVIQLVGILHTNAQAKVAQPKPTRTPPAFSVRGKTAAQLFAEFNEGIETRAEVRNGN